MAESFNSTPSEQVVRQVATIIGVDDAIVDNVCKRMEEEFILQEWQMSALDASEWKALEAPIGLAAAIRKLASVEDRNDAWRTNKSGSAPSVIASRSPYAQRLTDATKGSFANRSGHKDPKSAEMFIKTIHEEKEKQGGSDDDDASQIDAESGRTKPPPTKPHSLFKLLYKNHHEACKAFHSTTFPLSDTFDRALLHSKSGADLKAHTVFKMEISVVVAALLLGAAIELWGIFPQDAVAQKHEIPDGGEPYVPYIMALIFHTLSGLTILTQLMTVFLNVGQLYVATAISENKFPKFFQQILATTAWTNGLFQLGVVAFMVNIGILVMGTILATTSDKYTIIVCGLIIPLLVVIPCEMLFHVLLTYVGRTAFNGFLLVSHDNPNSDDILSFDPTSASVAEGTLCQNYFLDVNTNDEEVLDRIQRLRQQHTRSTSTRGVESTTIRNSRLIVPLANKHNIGPDYFPKFQGVKKPS
ncbi:unnamed protein product [Cylindrotheca closterium]|uniref:Uncharacterized protein n=1 Tax=Cylindrotheca closterium TaxID=2856 RepID=A0AAD2CTY3_9STRA|nr:unnamed protein product [Cylindrotheca closterium]